MTARRSRRRAGKGPWRDPDPDVLGDEVLGDDDDGSFALDELGFAILANLDLGPGARSRSIGGLDALASTLGGSR